jgi:hypothetical protein
MAFPFIEAPLPGIVTSPPGLYLTITEPSSTRWQRTLIAPHRRRISSSRPDYGDVEPIKQQLMAYQLNGCPREIAPPAPSSPR